MTYLEVIRIRLQIENNIGKMIQSEFAVGVWGGIKLFGEREIIFPLRLWPSCATGHLFKLSHHAEALGLMDGIMLCSVL